MSRYPASRVREDRVTRRPRWYALTFHDDAHWELFSRALLNARERSEHPHDIRLVMRQNSSGEERLVYFTFAAYATVKGLAQVFGVKQCPRPEGEDLVTLV